MRTAFQNARIHDVEIRTLSKHVDERGWLCELFRNDEICPSLLPAMCYASLTRPGITRGPHEHQNQTDWFCFIGPSNFLVVLWDNRHSSSTFNCRMRLVFGEDSPAVVIVPPGVVHGYRNIANKDGLVINLPNRLFRGQGRTLPVDEIRYEADPSSQFNMDSQ